METKLLLPNRYKRLGWIIFVPCLILTILSILQLTPALSFFDGEHILSKWTSIKVPEKGTLEAIFDETSNDLAGEILMTLTAIGFFFVAFSRERTDELPRNVFFGNGAAHPPPIRPRLGVV